MGYRYVCGYVVGPLNYSRTGERCMCKCQKWCVRAYNNKLVYLVERRIISFIVIGYLCKREPCLIIICNDYLLLKCVDSLESVSGRGSRSGWTPIYDWWLVVINLVDKRSVAHFVVAHQPYMECGRDYGVVDLVFVREACVYHSHFIKIHLRVVETICYPLFFTNINILYTFTGSLLQL